MDTILDGESKAATGLRVVCKNGQVGVQRGRVLIFWLMVPMDSVCEDQIWNLEIDVFETLSQAHVEFIWIVDIDGHRHYETTLDQYRKKGVLRRHRKYGPQLCLPFSFWKVTDMWATQQSPD